MKNSRTVSYVLAMISGLLYLIYPATAAFSQNNPPAIEGTITSMNKTGFALTLTDGSKKTIIINDKTRISRRVNATLRDIKAGEPLGVTSAPDSDNKMVAKAITIFPAGLLGRIRNGQFPMGDSGNTMTNAQVLQYTAGSTGHTLKMKITEGMPDILVPDGIPIVRMILMKQSDLKVDRTVHVRSQNQSGDVVTADFVDIVK